MHATGERNARVPRMPEHGSQNNDEKRNKKKRGKERKEKEKNRGRPGSGIWATLVVFIDASRPPMYVPRRLLLDRPLSFLTPSLSLVFLPLVARGSPYESLKAASFEGETPVAKKGLGNTASNRVNCAAYAFISLFRDNLLIVSTKRDKPPCTRVQAGFSAAGQRWTR